MATAIALLIYFWRDWIRIIGGFLSSIRDRRVRTEDQKLAWMIILATIPVGIAGLLFEHAFRVIFGKPVIAGVFLAVNGLILLAGEAYRRRRRSPPTPQSPPSAIQAWSRPPSPSWWRSAGPRPQSEPGPRARPCASGSRPTPCRPTGGSPG